jgi:hypothetical protein
MRNIRSKLEQELDEKEGTLNEISDLVEEALDPEMTREEVVAKLKEIQDALPGEPEEEEEEETTQ